MKGHLLLGFNHIYSHLQISILCSLRTDRTILLKMHCLLHSIKFTPLLIQANQPYLSLLIQAQHSILSRASAAALSTVLRTTTLSYGNMRFSGTCQAETPQPIKMKFCTIDEVGEVTRCSKNGWNRFAGGGPTDRWNIASKTFLTILYLTLPFLFL
jgi:hypothetical protein